MMTNQSDSFALSHSTASAASSASVHRDRLGKTENDFDAMAAAWNTLDLDPAVVITLDEPLHEAHRERTTALSLDPTRSIALNFSVSVSKNAANPKDRPGGVHASWRTLRAADDLFIEGLA